MIRSLTEPKLGPPDHGTLGIDEPATKARIGGIRNRHPAVGLAVGVVRNGRLELFSGHGVADIAATTHRSKPEPPSGSPPDPGPEQRRPPPLFPPEDRPRH